MLPKRKQGLSIGEYLLIASVNRGLEVASKGGMWSWFQGTILLNYFAGIKKEQLSSQRFRDQIHMIPEEKITTVWMGILNNVLLPNHIDLSGISYDETNFYTFISTFNKRCTIAQRGKNKQGRSNLRQVNYALFCSKESHIPLYFDVYQGNTHDSAEFKKILPGLKTLLRKESHLHQTLLLSLTKGIILLRLSVNLINHPFTSSVH